MAESNALTRQFDDAAQLYDEVRPRYPEPIVEQIIAFAALPAHGRIFEVGCGTGQMTLPFALRGYTMVAIDQGERLAGLAAQAIHWIEPHYGIRRAAELLKPGGTIALVGTADRSQGSAFWQATEPIYSQYNPVDSTANLQPRWPGEAYRQALCISGQFGELQEVRTSWAKRYSGEEYVKLLWTSSDHRAMPEPHRSRFFEAIRRVIAQMGGEVIRDYETLAPLAKKS